MITSIAEGALMKRDIISEASSIVHRKLKSVDHDFTALPGSLQTFLRVEVVQGILDNGGLQYFFESNFEDEQPYANFVDSYREIGAGDEAIALEKAVAFFSFPNPHLDSEQRCIVMESLWRDVPEFADIDNLLCGNKAVWDKLAAYVLANREEFPIR
ncbi:MAG: DUF4375 domain-containing protein [Pirellulales bacterium]